MHGRVYVWQGACVAGGVCMAGGMCVRLGHEWQGGMHGRGSLHGRGACVVGGMHDGVWCMAMGDYPLQ